MFICVHSKPHLHNSLIDLKDFLTQTAQGKRYTIIKNKIVNIVDTFLDMAADSLVPVLSGTHGMKLTLMLLLIHNVVKCDPTPANEALCGKINSEL